MRKLNDNVEQVLFEPKNCYGPQCHFFHRYQTEAGDYLKSITEFSAEIMASLNHLKCFYYWEDGLRIEVEQMGSVFTYLPDCVERFEADMKGDLYWSSSTDLSINVGEARQKHRCISVERLIPYHVIGPKVGLSNVRSLSDLEDHKFWPQLNNSRKTKKPDKALPHTASLITIKPRNSHTQSAKITIRWGLFLPLKGECLIENIPGEDDISVLLHACFFLSDKGRTSFFGQSDLKELLNKSKLSSQSHEEFKTVWNVSLIQEGVCLRL